MRNTFLFKGKFYDQSDGVAIGPPLAPALANLFMGYYEKEWLSNYDGVSPSYYTRYIDDIFSVFNSHDEAKRFFSYLNSRQPNIKFTIIQDNLILNLPWKQRLTKLFPFLMSLVIITTIFCMHILNKNQLILVYY